VEFDYELDESNYISHHGVAHDENPPGRGSGRYAYGTGNRPNQHAWDLKDRIVKLRQSGMTDAEIARALQLWKLDYNGNPIVDKETGEYIASVSRLKAEYQIATNTVKLDQAAEVAWYDSNINPETGKTFTTAEISRILGVNESTIRSIRDTAKNNAASKTFDAADTLRNAVNEKGMIDVGSGTELLLNISPDRLKTTLEVLKKEGYEVYTIPIKQVTGVADNQTNMLVLCPPGMTYKEAFKDKLNIKSLEDIDGMSLAMVQRGITADPVRVELDRVKVVFAEEGGTDRDGLIQLRAIRDENGNLIPACDDLSLGNAKYAQVRIATEGDHFIKGMAVYSDQLPDGVDILVNSNKSIEKGKEGALKDLEKNNNGELTDNPFGATTIPTEYTDSVTGEKKRSPINIVGAPTQDNSDAHVEGRWMNWSKNVPSQMLSKQSVALAKQQLKLKSLEMEDQYSTIMSLNNEVVKKKLLQSFADECDAAAVELKAASFAGQCTHAILPVKSLKDNEVYAPNYANGTQIALVRFPHAGPFEIPILTVNNNNKEARSFMKNAKDAVGINSTNASKLSGADFDGDTVVVIPVTRLNSKGETVTVNKIRNQASLAGLAGFDPTACYNAKATNAANADGSPKYRVMNDREKGIKMGEATNLITDMYARGCTGADEITRAVKYSMVMIDAKKHKLNYKQAYKDLNIAELQNKYQKKGGGVSSLLSRATHEVEVEARQQGYDIDPDTGEKKFRSPTKTTASKATPVYVTAPAGAVYKDASGKLKKYKSGAYLKDENGNKVQETWTGKLVKNSDGTYTYNAGNGKTKWTYTEVARKSTSTMMYEAKDARELYSDPKNPSQMEVVYADYANHMKTLGNKARKSSLQTKPQKKDPVAAKTYAAEVESLNQKLVTAKKNSVRERQAQIVATSIVNAAYATNKDMDSDDRKKLKGQAIKTARNATGASKTRVTFTEKEWEAVTKNAISPSTLSQLLDNADSENYTRLAMPKTDKISAAKRSRIKSMAAAGYTQEQIAQMVGVSTSSVSGIVNAA
jgi:DNA-binding CsgD family transcriptional regulator